MRCSVGVGGQCLGDPLGSFRIVEVKDKSLAVGTDMRAWKWMWQRESPQGSWKTKMWGEGRRACLTWGPLESYLRLLEPGAHFYS